MEGVVSSTESYLSLFLSLPQVNPVTAFSCFLLILARLVPILLIAPFFGAKIVPAPIRMGLGLCISVIFFPQVLMTVKGDIIFNTLFMGYLAKEIFIGFILGFLITLPFYVAQSSGSLIDHIRGASSLQVSDPMSQTQTGPLGLIYNYLMIVIFFAIGGPFLFLEAVSKSFALVPVNAFFPEAFFSATPFWKLIFHFIDEVFRIALQLGAPAILGILMTDLFLGIANRLAPQVQIVFLGISLKSWVGLMLLAAAWFFILSQMRVEAMNWIHVFQKMIQHFAT